MLPQWPRSLWWLPAPPNSKLKLLLLLVLLPAQLLLLILAPITAILFLLPPHQSFVYMIPLVATNTKTLVVQPTTSTTMMSPTSSAAAAAPTINPPSYQLSVISNLVLEFIPLIPHHACPHSYLIHIDDQHSNTVQHR